MQASMRMQQRRAFTPAGARAQQQRPATAAARAPRRRGGAVCLAAMSGAAGEDPYKVLGVPPDSDTNAINRAFTVKKFNARGDEPELARIEAAHSQIMMNSLSARLKGVSVANEVRFADQEPLFPWRPKRWDATPQVIAVVGVMQIAVTAFALQAPNMSKVIGSGRNFVRAALLGLMATFSGVLLFSAPEFLAQWGRAALPEVLQSAGVQVSLKCAGAALANWIMTSFFY
ncbi:glycosyl hydrolase [Raphidocelis subcapitata]|uniref:Glycosyl hydrolase n=1 Tax=Raphidocelis subcapitata TaxID=307507 RepID=A0A2V0P9E4_9CHLO|nr:glycosyl hydrolase [Raphidocelis subcapitata]|eukprot:GBF96478.1 glycosyl hydrolase [Raphidocelis subcapitata]